MTTMLDRILGRAGSDPHLSEETEGMPHGDDPAGGDAGSSLAGAIGELTADLRQAHEALNKEIQERRLCEESLRRSLRQRRLLVDACPIGIAVVDPGGLLTDCNRRLEDVFGMAREEILRIDFHGDVVSPEIAAAVLAACSGAAIDGAEVAPVALPTGQVVRIVCRSVGADDDTARGALLFVMDESPYGAVPAPAEDGLLGLAALDLMPDAVILQAGREGVRVLRGAEQIGLGPEAVNGEAVPVSEVLPGDAGDRFQRYVRLTLRSGAAQEVGISLFTGGATREFLARFAPCGEDRVLACLRDVAAERQAALERRVLEGRIATLESRIAELQAAACAAPAVEAPEASAEPGAGAMNRAPTPPALEAPEDAAEPAEPEAPTEPEPSAEDLLTSADPAQRLEGARMLAEAGEAQRAVCTLLECLRCEDATVRGTAAFVLGRIGADAAAAVDELTGRLLDSDRWVRAYAATALGEIGAPAAAAAARLVALHGDGDPLVRSSAASALAKLGPLPSACEPELRRLSESEDPNVRAAASAALGRVTQSA